MPYKNKEKIKENAKKYYKFLKEHHPKKYKEILKKNRNFNKNWKEKNPNYNKEWYKSYSGRYSRYKRSAKERKIGFDLTIEEFITFWQEPCDYCEDKIETIGLDRVDSKKGYSIDNVVPCCRYCNMMKFDLDRDEFIKRIILMFNRIKDKYL